MTHSQHPPNLPSSRDFDAMYLGSPPWDIGRPQTAFLEVATAGELHGRVLDVGCGTGEHALMAARLGLDATGVDTSSRAISMAKAKAQERGLSVRFLIWDALELTALGEHFDTVLDSGLYHVFDDTARARYVETLTSVVRHGGRYFLLCFSDRQPAGFGPRRIREDEIRASFRQGWRIDSLAPKTMEMTIDPHGAQGWLAAITRAAHSG
jgi:SAM-dependent methyltransferase